jgi:probable H4MPT-linked C1 transfer pathway protein
MQERVLGLDIGGANLKAAHVSGTARTRGFAVWKQPARLAAELSELVATLPAHDSLAVTMTAELCDCFATKHEGVGAILDAVETVAAGKPIQVWQNDGGFVPVAEARRESHKTAAANWLALATLASRFYPRGLAVLIDIGSTTTDVVPIFDGVPRPQGRTDPERLAAHELIYMGVLRTPLCALLPTITWRNRTFHPAAEWFATTRDAYLLLDRLPEEPDDLDTADGRPATRHHAHGRVARLLCADREHVSMEEARGLAEQVEQEQLRRLAAAWAAVQHRFDQEPGTILVAGSGEFLTHAAVRHFHWQSELVSLGRRLGPEMSRAACAYAVAVLAAERGSP